MSCVLINSTGETFTPTRSGAICTWTWEMCRAAESEGVQPLVITRDSEAKAYPWLRTVFLSYPWIPSFRGTGIGRLIKMQQRLTGWGHSRQGAYARKIVRAIRRNCAEKMPFVLQNDPELAVFLRRHFPDAFILHHFHNSNVCSKRFREKFAQSVNEVTAVSRHCADWNGEYFARAVKVLYNGVDTERFSPTNRRMDELPVVGFVGRTDRQKAPDLLLRAALLVSEKTRGFGIQILGSRYYGYSERDAYQDEIEALSTQLEERGISVRRPGFIDRANLPDELRKAQIHVVPSRWDEPFGLVTLEGMACGLATIASRTGGTPEVVGDAGLAFERDATEELASHLMQLIANDAMRLEFGRKARLRALEFRWKDSWAHLCEYLHLSSSVAGERKALALND